jgi:organic hydroperoxide reductase OsmC/OhrA
MQAFPHRYAVATSAEPAGDVVLRSDGLEPLPTAAPAEFGGPGNRWSPETMLVGAVANCFVLTFRAIASASKLQWSTARWTGSIA